MDEYLWFYYLEYSVFTLMVLALTDKMRKIILLNVEVLSTLGIYIGKKDEINTFSEIASSAGNYFSMMKLLMIMVTAIYYNLLKSPELFGKILAMRSGDKIQIPDWAVTIRNTVLRFFNSYMIWMFHILLNVFLFYDIKRDFFIYLIFFSELVVIIIH